VSWRAIGASLLFRGGSGGLLGILCSLLPERQPVGRQFRQFRVSCQQSGLFLPEIEEALGKLLGIAPTASFCLRIIHVR